MNDSMSVCTIGFFLSHVEDEETSSVLQFAIQLSQAYLQKLISFFNEENIPVPNGFFVENDVNNGVPRLFTDDFYLFYIQNMGKSGM